MIGSIRWNLAFGLAAFVLTFFGSMTHNVWMTTITHSLYSFAILFIIGFPVRWVLGTMVGLKTGFEGPKGEKSGQVVRGTNLDLVTPDETLQEMINGGATPESSQADDDFTPLRPARLTTKPSADLDPEELAKALRRMSED